MVNDAAHLVKGRKYVVGELDLGNGSLAHRRNTNSKTYNTLL
jgi:hypothetical protein